MKLAMHILGILTMIVCTIAAVSYPGATSQFRVTCGLGALLIMPMLVFVMHPLWWTILLLMINGCAFTALHSAPPDISIVPVLNLGWYPGVLLMVMSLFALIVTYDGWVQLRLARKHW